MGMSSTWMGPAVTCHRRMVELSASKPGPLGTYVWRWPQISASSQTPPRVVLWKGRPSARLIDCPNDRKSGRGGQEECQQHEA
jgi:hypothetical protein